MTLQKALVAAGIVALSLFIWVAAQHTLAGGASALVQLHQDAWRKASNPPSLSEWKKADRFFQQALWLDPNDPKLLSMGGRLYQWRAIMEWEEPALRNEWLDRSIEHHLLSVKRRPSWPYGWLDLATAKVWQKRWDVSFQHAFEQMVVWGGWEKRVFFGAAKLGLTDSRKLNQANLQRFLQTLRRGLDKFPSQILKIAKQHGKQTFVCGLVGSNEWAKKHCQRKRELREQRKKRLSHSS